MSLQISEWHYSGDDPALIGNCGHVYVRGPGVDARFEYAGFQGITRDDAMRQAREFASTHDLLAALREIVKNDPYNQSSAGIIARAAIAKAEGEL